MRRSEEFRFDYVLPFFAKSFETYEEAQYFIPLEDNYFSYIIHHHKPFINKAGIVCKEEGYILGQYLKGDLIGYFTNHKISRRKEYGRGK